MKLYFYYLSSYSQKALMAFYEKGVAFTPHLMDTKSPEAWAEHARRYPMGKVPLLELPTGEIFSESSVIIEYLDVHHPGPPILIPRDPAQALRVRQLDRIFDSYVNEPFIKIFSDTLRLEGTRDPFGVDTARKLLTKAYGYLDGLLAQRTFAAGDSLTLADCAAAPALAYSEKVHPFEPHKNLSAYFRRLAERPSFVRIKEEMAPYWEALIQ